MSALLEPQLAPRRPDARPRRPRAVGWPTGAGIAQGEGA